MRFSSLIHLFGIIIYFSLFLFVPSRLQAQIQKGSKFIGGGLSAGKTMYSESPGNSTQVRQPLSLSVGPAFGVLLNDQLALGFSFQYGRSIIYSYENGSDRSKWRVNSFSPAIFIRRYIPIAEKFWFTVEGNLSYTTISSKWKNHYNNRVYESGNDWDYLTASFYPAFNFFPSPSWCFEARIGTLAYQLAGLSGSGGKSHGFMLDYGTVNLRLSYFWGLNRRKGREG